MRGFGIIALLVIGIGGCETSSQDCVQHGGICASACPNDYAPLSVQQYQYQSSDYGCVVDSGLTGVQCCLPVPVTN